MSPVTNRRLVVLALIGCFALAFGAAYVLELALIWLLEIRLRMPFVEVANILVTTWRTLAALAVAGLLCIWLSRR